VSQLFHLALPYAQSLPFCRFGSLTRSRCPSAASVRTTKGRKVLNNAQKTPSIVRLAESAASKFKITISVTLKEPEFYWHRGTRACSLYPALRPQGVAAQFNRPKGGGIIKMSGGQKH
jgi:hypothetical protein